MSADTDTIVASIRAGGAVGADLRGLILANVDLSGTNLSRSDVRESSFVNVDFHNTNLRGADLGAVRARHCKFDRADLTVSNMWSVTLDRSSLAGACMEAANLKDATLYDVDLHSADLNSANLAGATLSDVDLTGCNIWAISLESATLRDCKATTVYWTRHSKDRWLSDEGYDNPVQIDESALSRLADSLPTSLATSGIIAPRVVPLLPACFRNGLACQERIEVNPETVFVLMPFSQQFNDVFEAIRAAAEEIDMSCHRADSEIHVRDIMCKICKKIQNAGYIVADLTDGNPNVYYELGIAHTLNKPVMLLAQDFGSVPFDLRSYNTQRYDRNDLSGLRSELKDRLDTLVRDRKPRREHP